MNILRKWWRSLKKSHEVTILEKAYHILWKRNLKNCSMGDLFEGEHPFWPYMEDGWKPK